MGAPLQAVALVARTLSLMYDKPLVAVNHCVGREPPERLVQMSANYHQISKWEEKLLGPEILWSCTFPEATPRLSPILGNATAFLGKLWISPSETVWTDSLVY